MKNSKGYENEYCMGCVRICFDDAITWLVIRSVIFSCIVLFFIIMNSLESLFFFFKEKLFFAYCPLQKKGG